MSGRFAKQNRLLRKADFSHVFRNAKRDQGPFFLVLYTSNELNRARMGLAVSRKVSLRAVRRNRIKRRVRESFRQNKEHLNGLDIVFIARPAAATADSGKLDASIIRHWQKLSNHA